MSSRRDRPPLRWTREETTTLIMRHPEWFGCDEDPAKQREVAKNIFASRLLLNDPQAPGDDKKLVETWTSLLMTIMWDDEQVKREVTKIENSVKQWYRRAMSKFALSPVYETLSDSECIAFLRWNVTDRFFTEIANALNLSIRDLLRTLLSAELSVDEAWGRGGDIHRWRTNIKLSLDDLSELEMLVLRFRKVDDLCVEVVSKRLSQVRPFFVGSTFQPQIPGPIAKKLKPGQLNLTEVEVNELGLSPSIVVQRLISGEPYLAANDVQEIERRAEDKVRQAPRKPPGMRRAI